MHACACGDFIPQSSSQVIRFHSLLSYSSLVELLSDTDLHMCVCTYVSCTYI